MTNVDLLRQTLEHIETHPELWDQMHWAHQTACGTAYCFAGTALMLAGKADFAWYGRELDGLTYASEMANGEDIHDAAAALLELDEEDAVELFCPDNDLGQLRDLVAKLTRLDGDAPPPDQERRRE